MSDFGEDPLVETFDDVVEVGKTSSILTPEKHLDSPILISLLIRLQDLCSRVFDDQKHIKRTQYDPLRTNALSMFLHKNPDLAYSSIRTPLLQYSSALDFCRKDPEILDAKKYPLLFSYTSYSPYRLQSDFDLSRSIFEKELDAYLDQTDGILSKQKRNHLRKVLMPRPTLGTNVVMSACRAQLWSDIVEDYRKNYKRHSDTIKKTFGPLRVVHCDGFSLIKSDDLDRWQLCTYEQLQMIQDCCLARHNIELALRFNFHNGSQQLRSHVVRIFEWQERVLKVIGNSGYELVKAPEAVFKAWLNSLTDGDLLRYSSYSRTLDKMLEKEAKLHDRLFLVAELDQIVRNVVDIHDAAELFGLSKLSGHPSVFAKVSAASVRDEAIPKGSITPFAVRQLNRMFKHLTLSGYIHHHQNWPKFLCPPAPGTVLRRLYLNLTNTLPMGCYPMSDLDAVEFGKFCDYDYSEDYLKFLDDKAICPGATEMSKFWFSGARQESRRLLQKILELKTFSTVDLVERLRKGAFKDDEYVVELTQKERELKIAARCFCKLVFEVRTFFTSTEYNLKEHFMAKYMPQQTMTMSNTETKKRLYNMVKDAKHRSRTLLEVDFSRWNLRWRQETVNGVAIQLEQIFGLDGVFSQAHPFFERSTVVLTDKHTLPYGARPDIPVTQWPESDLLWRGKHRGGFEGIQQGLWTICTIAMMYWVMHDQQLSFLMAGQGDNQIFAISFDTAIMPMDVQLRKLLAVMEVRCKFLNHVVKPDECIDSQTVLTYSKDIYVNGNHILYNLKFASRTFKREEIDVPSLSSEIASISACSMACADSVYATPRAIHWKTFHTIRLLSFRYRSPNYQTEAPSLSLFLSDPELCEFLILLPGSLGGIPCMAWSRFYMKGEVDDLSWDVPAYRALGRYSRIYQWDMKLLLDGKYSGKQLDRTQLILDPHSIPLNRPKDLKRLIKKAVEDVLLDHTKNIWIREVASDQNVAAGAELLSTLANSTPFYPQIMSDLYALSPAGVRDALVARFTMTRTIVSITGNPNFSSEIAAANARLLQFIETRYRSARQMRGIPSLPETCYDTCKKLRQLWGDGVEHKNIGTYNPLDFTLRPTDTSVPSISASSRCEASSLHDTLGPYPPNFGTTTKQKVSDHGYKITTSSSTMRDLKKIVLTHSELGSSKEMEALLSNIVSARSPWSLQQLIPILPTSFGGAAAHRHAAINSKAFSILGSRTVPTHLNFCSDIAGKLSGGEYDFPVAFQEFYLALTSIYQVLTYFGDLDPNSSISFQLRDEYEPLPTDPVTCKLLKRPRWAIHPNNALCYVGRLTVTEIPDTPHPSVIPHIRSDELQPRILIYNKLLSQFARHRRTFQTTSSVNLPIEFIDMKEFNHCPLNDLIIGTCWFISAMAIHTAVVEFTRNAAIALNEIVYRLSRSCSAILARTMLHPDFASTVFACEYGVVCEPGVAGARSAADNLTGELYNTTLLHIRARSFVTQNVPLILFADYSTHIAYTAEIHSTAHVGLQSFDVSRVIVTPHQWLLLKSARYSLLARSSPMFIALNYKSVVEHLMTDSHDGSIISRVTLQYCNMTPEEAIRALRSRPLQTRVKVQRPDAPRMAFGSHRGAIEIHHLAIDGSIKPAHVCRDTTDGERIIDNFLSICIRPLGVYSTATSVWYQILSRVSARIQGKRVISVGVGHGAVAAVSLIMGAQVVFGVDLRSSFPSISQREGTYKPPEVITAGVANQFIWSRIVSQIGGDATRVDSSTPLEDHDTIVIDIEDPQADLMGLYSCIQPGSCVVLRLVCCTEWARYYCDALGADLLFNTSQVVSHRQSYILIVKKFTLFNQNANYQRIDLFPGAKWDTTLPRTAERTVERFNHFLLSVGERVTSVSLTTVREVASRVRNRSLHCHDEHLRQRLDIVSDALVAACHTYENLDNVDITNLLTLTPLARRLTALWLSNTHVPLGQLRASLLADDGSIRP